MYKISKFFRLKNEVRKQKLAKLPLTRTMLFIPNSKRDVRQSLKTAYKCFVDKIKPYLFWRFSKNSLGTLITVIT